MRLIDADALVQMLENDAKHMEDPVGRAWTYAAINDIKNAPTADVVDKALYKRLLENSVIIAAALNSYQTADMVEVVRCKDCKWFDMTEPCGTIAPNAHRCKRVTRLWMDDDAFCSYGERREDE